MAEYIEKQAAIDALGKPTEVYSWEDALMREQWERDKAAIEAIPPADVRPVVRGRWELAKDGWYCTACELYPPFDCDTKEKGIPFCPWCGADMRGYECE